MLVALGASFVWTPAARAADYYVSTTGSDSNPGTEASPFGSIQWAADISTPGDTTFVRGGTYSENFHAGASVVLRNDGTASDWINFRAYPGETPVIDHDTYAGFLVLGNYVEISGFEVTTSTGISNPGDSSDGQNWGSGISVVGNYEFAGPSFENKRPHHVRINDNHVYGMGGSGITATRTDYLQLEGNRIHDNSFYNPNQSSGISLYQLIDHDTASGYHNIIRGNTSYSNQNTVSPSGGGNRTDGNGIIIDDGRNEQFNSTYPAYTGSTLIENNVLFDNGGRGVNVYKSDNVDIINNTLFKNGKDPEVGPYQIAHGEASNIRVFNNVLYGRSPTEAINFAFFESNISYDNNLFFNGITNTSSGVSYGANDIYSQDPLLTNPTLNYATADFHQTPASPTINNGNPTVHALTDFEGVARPLGGGYDIGAYEVVASILGDIDGDGDLDADDLDALAAVAGSADLTYDLNGDGKVDFEAKDTNAADPTDSDYLVRTILGTEYGDANLDGDVDIVDFDLLGQGFQGQGTGWLYGDFSGSGGATDIVDFDLLGQFFGFSAAIAASTAIPEPAAIHLSFCLLLIILARHQRPQTLKQRPQTLR